MEHGSVYEYIMANSITVEQVAELRDSIPEGTKVRGEIYIADTDTGRFTEEEVTILKKYPAFAMTDKGTVLWTDIAIRNRRLLRRGV